MKVSVRSSAGGTYEVVSEDGRSVLIHTDTDFPGLAGNLGWSPTNVQKWVGRNGFCRHEGTDGTVDCPCGCGAADFITYALAFLQDHQGETFEDPGYFESLERPMDAKSILEEMRASQEPAKVARLFARLDLLMRLGTPDPWGTDRLTSVPPEIKMTARGAVPGGADQIKWSGLSTPPAVGSHVDVHGVKLIRGPRGGTQSMSFTGTVLGYAVERGYLYLRVRPDRIPSAVGDSERDRMVHIGCYVAGVDLKGES